MPFSIRPGQFQPVPFMQVPRHGCLLNERIVNALMGKGRWLGTTVSLVVAHDELASDGPDASGEADLVSADSLKEDSLFHPCDLLDMFLGTVEENEN